MEKEIATRHTISKIHKISKEKLLGKKVLIIQGEKKAKSPNEFINQDVLFNLLKELNFIKIVDLFDNVQAETSEVSKAEDLIDPLRTEVGAIGSIKEYLILPEDIIYFNNEIIIIHHTHERFHQEDKYTCFISMT